MPNHPMPSHAANGLLSEGKWRQRTVPLRALRKGDYTADILGVNGMSTGEFTISSASG